MKLATRQCPVCLLWVNYFDEDEVFFNGKHYHKKCHEKLQKALKERRKK